MTCIAAVTDGVTVVMGADSNSQSGSVNRTMLDPKVFRVGPLLFGISGGARAIQIIRYAFEPPERVAETGLYMLKVSEALRTCLHAHGFRQKENDVESASINALIGYQGKVYDLDSAFFIGEMAGDCHAAGCGREYALGSLFTSSGTPYERVLTALKAAAEYDSGVGGPFIVESMGGITT